MLTPLLVAALAIPTPVLAFADRRMEACKARVKLGLDDHDICILRAAERTGKFAEAERWLRERIARDPYHAPDRINLGRLLLRRGDPETAAQLERGIEDAEAGGELRAWAVGHAVYARWLGEHKQMAGFYEHFALARDGAERLGDTYLAAAVRVDEASFLQEHDTGLGRAEEILRETEALYGPELTGLLGVKFHDTWSTLALSTGRLETAVEQHRLAAEEARDRGFVTMYARHRYDEATTRDLVRSERGQHDDERLVETLGAVIDAADEVGDYRIVTLARALLGDRLPAAPGIAIARQCLGDEHVDAGTRSACLRTMAWGLTRAGQEGADVYLDEALSTTKAYAELLDVLYTLEVAADTHWVTGQQKLAIADGLLAIAVVEALGQRQGDPMARARVSAAWAAVVYETAGRLLRHFGDDPQAVALAFAVVERMRARVLREALTQAGARSDPARPEPTAQEESFSRLLQVRARFRERLDTGFAETLRPLDTTPAQVQEHLGPNEALLSFQLDDLRPFDGLGGLDLGGSWLTVVTRDEVYSVPLPNISDLEAKIDGLIGIFDAGREPSAELRHVVFEAVFGGALERLPDSIDHLMIVPDGPLHRMPFATLAHHESGEPLVSRFALSLVPSAGMWLGWRARGTMPMDRSVLLLADPVLGPDAQDAAAEVSAWRDDREPSLRPLPRARDEVRAIADRVGPLAMVFEGAEATEARVLDIARGAGVVHLATHTVLDSRHPERAALVLAPGPEHDGLVHVSEIASHPLDDAVVVLAACRGADGLVLRGEGLMGLVRGYLQAGARAVVASRWPLSDVRAARFFVAFYDELATGATVSDALAETQRRWIEQGGSPEIWAGLVVVGDGSARPLSPRPEPFDPWRVIGLALCVAGVGALAWGRHLRRP